MLFVYGTRIEESQVCFLPFYTANILYTYEMRNYLGTLKQNLTRIILSGDL